MQHLARVQQSIRVVAFLGARGGLIGMSLVIGLLGCKDLVGSSSVLPSGTENPAYFSTPAGALGMRVVALQSMAQAIPGYILDAGLLTDELESNLTGLVGERIGGGVLPTAGSLDERYLPEQTFVGAGGTAADGDYANLMKVRALISQAVGALATYDTGAVTQGEPLAMRGELYALEGYAEILLADLFCSGVPLSTLDFQKDFTYHAGSTTQQVYQDAIIKLDSAVQLTTASYDTRDLNLALVLKGRAWLDLASFDAAAFDSAAAAVAGVPNGYKYMMSIQLGGGNNLTGFVNSHILTSVATLSNREGGTGLPFLSRGDPRTAPDSALEYIGIGSGLNYVYFPRRYDAGKGTGVDFFNDFTIADGIEARLIQAEVALHTAPSAATWLAILNQLRATASIPGTNQPATAQQLPPLVDPGDSPGNAARIALLFQERAYWLHVTGHRQGDLRRLIRLYGFDPQAVYPTGAYRAVGGGTYGSDVTAPIPSSEYINPLFHGCLGRSA